MLIYLTKPLKGYAHREGEVIGLPSDLATKVINEGGALPYTADEKEVVEVKAIEEVKKVEPIKPTQNVAHKGSKKTRK